MEERRVQIDEMQITYRVSGQGAPLVMIHGLGASARWWDRNVRALARHFRVYVIDLVGFGDSRCGQPFVLGEAATCLAKWMDAVGIHQATLIAHSMGGFIAADLAAEFPERVERLVLVDAAVVPFETNILQNGFGLMYGFRYLPLSLLPLLITDNWRAGLGTLSTALRDLLSLDLRPKLARIQAPTLIVWGENDPVTPLKMGEALAEAIPHAQFKVLSGVAHNAMWERPADFNGLVLDFLGIQTTNQPTVSTTALALRRPPLHQTITHLRTISA